MSGESQDLMPLLRAWFPKWTDQERHDVRWNCTAYPCAGYEHVKKQLRRLRTKAIRGATADELIGEAKRELEAAMDAAWDRNRANREADPHAAGSPRQAQGAQAGDQGVGR